MISPGRSKKRASRGGLRPGTFSRPDRAGFTLIELALSLSLIVMLAGVVAVTVGRGQERRRFIEVASRFETLLRITRAEAQNNKRRFRIEFGDPDEMVDFDVPTPVRVMWEPEHLTAPGEFVRYPLATWELYVPDQQVRVLRCRLIGPSAYRTITGLTGGDEEDEDALQPITFYPDGWSDSALIELAPPEFDSRLRAAIRFDGDSGNVKVLILTEEQLEEYHDDIEEGIYDPDDEEDG